MASKSTFYEILEVSPQASPLEIKKAYRRLALKYHPDRNNGSQDSKERFQQIGIAYECLADERKRAEYDATLRGEKSTVGTSVQSGNPFGQSYYGRRPFDPFQQFDHLFRTDPFFKEAFQDMDDEFAKRFKADGDSERGSYQKESWTEWLLRKCGIHLEMSSYRSDGGGGLTATHYSSVNRSHKSTRSYIDSHGRNVTIREMQTNGNAIQDKIISGQLVERRINGRLIDEVGQLE